MRSPCHNARVSTSLGDGVLIGWCETCDKPVVRYNQKAGRDEWLDGESPWTTRTDLRPVTEEEQKLQPEEPVS